MDSNFEIHTNKIAVKRLYALPANPEFVFATNTTNREYVSCSNQISQTSNFAHMQPS